MKMGAELQIFLSLIVSMCVLICHGKDVASEVFIVQPTMTRHKHSVEWDGIECSFSYVSTGGTNEQWLMTLSEEGSGEFVCDVARPDSLSYLFFQEFAMTISGAELAAAVVFGEKREVQAPSGEYTVYYAEKTVMNGPSFSGSLNRVEAVLVKGREEL